MYIQAYVRSHNQGQSQISRVRFAKACGEGSCLGTLIQHWDKVQTKHCNYLRHILLKVNLALHGWRAQSRYNDGNAS